MSRKIIAGAGVVVLGIAALPFTGVFAADGGLTDTIKVTISKACQMEVEQAEGEVVWGTGLAGSAYETKNGTPMTITCNTQEGWTLKATATDLTNVANRWIKIPFGAYNEDSNASMWSAEITVEGGSTNYTRNETWADFEQAKDGDTVASGTSSGVIVVKPQYKAYVDSAQTSGFYEGTISYIFAENE